MQAIQTNAISNKITTFFCKNEYLAGAVTTVALTVLGSTIAAWCHTYEKGVNTITLSILSGSIVVALKVLTLSRTPIVETPSIVPKTSKNIDLEQKYNALQQAAYQQAQSDIAVAAATKLPALDFSNRSLAVCPPEIGKVSQLRTINLSNTQISTLPDNFGNLTQLRYLYLQNTQLTSLPVGIEKLEHLQVLNIQGTLIEHIPDAVRNISGLKIYD